MLQVIFTDTWNYNYFTGFSSHSDKIHNKMTGVWCGNKDTEELNLWAEVVLCVIDQSIDHIKAQEDMSGSIHDSLTTHHRTQRYNQALAHRHSGQQVVTLVNYILLNHINIIFSVMICAGVSWRSRVHSGSVLVHMCHFMLNNFRTETHACFIPHQNVSLHSIWENISDFREALKKRTLLEPLNAESEVLVLWPGPVCIK